MKYIFIMVFLAVIFTCPKTLAQEKYTINGYVKDAENGEELIGATVVVKESGSGTVTNVYGFYAISLPAGTYTIQYSYLGYFSVEKTFDLQSDVAFNVELPVESVQMEEVVVTDKAIDANVTDIKMSKNDLDIKQVKRLPALFGEPDIIKTIQMLPGVISAGEGTSSFFVRGGSADQNLILIDEAPVYDPSHLFGLFSVFNADVIKDSELYRGGIPSRYGGRLSSILEVRTKDGNNKKFGGNAGIGLLASKIMLEGPIKKDKSSFIISARRSYADVFLKAAGENNLVHFYDVNAKLNWKHNNKNRFFLAVYAGRDVFNFNDDFGFDWGNTTATFRWNHLFNDRLFSNTSVIASNFSYKLEQNDLSSGFEWVSDLKEFTIKEDLNYFLNSTNELEFGYHLTYRQFSPGRITPTSRTSLFAETALDDMFALDHAFYVGNQQKISNKLTLRYGLRLSVFQNIGDQDVFIYENAQDNIDPTRIDTVSYGSFENIKTYVNFEPRISARYILDLNSSIKASYNRMVQNTHLISSGTVPIPFNTWSPSSPYLEPQIADQVALGYFRNIKDNSIELSVEAYYKDIQNVTDFADNAQLFFNSDLPTEFRQGDSWSYGLELMAQKNEGKLTGFATYTWSKTEREIPEVNNDMPFLANYDRRHVFNAVATYQVNDQWTLGGNFTYSTGRPITLPAGRYEYEDYQVDFITERNGYKLPDFHRLDISATYVPKVKKNRKWQGSWSFSIYNLYSRKNAFTVFTRTREVQEDVFTNEKEAVQLSLFPILPSITYNVSF